jgi:hypothetical protein
LLDGVGVGGGFEKLGLAVILAQFCDGGGHGVHEVSLQRESMGSCLHLSIDYKLG